MRGHGASASNSSQQPQPLESHRPPWKRKLSVDQLTTPAQSSRGIGMLYRAPASCVSRAGGRVYAQRTWNPHAQMSRLTSFPPNLHREKKVWLAFSARLKKKPTPLPFSLAQTLAKRDDATPRKVSKPPNTVCLCASRTVLLRPQNSTPRGTPRQNGSQNLVFEAGWHHPMIVASKARQCI
jgi:hypothetical protein